MKTCPECAESVQDAARKCRYCGYRFEQETGQAVGAAQSQASHAQMAPAAAVAAGAVATARGSNRPFLLVALGGALIAFGGVMLVVTNAVDVGFVSIAMDGFIFGGIALAIGWGVLLRSRGTGISPLIGSVVLLGCWMAGAFFLSQSDDDLSIILTGMLGYAGLAACAFMHLDVLELEGMDGTRLAAMLAAAGFVVATVAASRQLPEVVQGIGIWVGTLGTVVFGAALAVSATRRGLEAAG